MILLLSVFVVAAAAINCTIAKDDPYPCSACLKITGCQFCSNLPQTEETPPVGGECKESCSAIEFEAKTLDKCTYDRNNVCEALSCTQCLGAAGNCLLLFRSYFALSSLKQHADFSRFFFVQQKKNSESGWLQMVQDVESVQFVVHRRRSHQLDDVSRAADAECLRWPVVPGMPRQIVAVHVLQLSSRERSDYLYVKPNNNVLLNHSLTDIERILETEATCFDGKNLTRW